MGEPVTGGVATADNVSGRLKGFAGGLVCLALTAGLYMAGAAAITGSETAGEAGFTLDVPDADIIGDDFGMPAEGLAPPEDDIPIDGTSEDAATEGADPADDAAPAFTPSEPPADEETMKALPRPIVLAAGRLRFAGGTVELAGIEPVATDRRCTASNGESWPCGRMARTAFANYVRGRTVSCSVPDQTWSETVRARCTLAGTDLARWLAENGWIDAGEDAGLLALAEDARSNGRGLHGPDLRKRRPALRTEQAPVIEPFSEDIAVE